MYWAGPEILGVSEMSALDRLAVDSGTPIATLMENAGRHVANEIAKRWSRQRAFVLCGPGNNGGDGYVVARHLRARGYDVTVKAIGDHAQLGADSGAMAKAWEGQTLAFKNTGTVREGLYIDAVFGAGLNRPISDDLSEYFYLVREAGCPIIAIDVPSGLHGDTSKFLGDRSWTADLTVTFFRKKPAHVLMPGRKNCGEVVVVDIGIPAGLIQALAEVAHEGALPDIAFAIQNERPSTLPEIAIDVHKYSRGHCLVVSGSALATGAARLAADAALRAGAGLVTLAASSDAARIIAGHITNEMVVTFDQPSDLGEILGDIRKNAAVIGPGLGRTDAAKALIAMVLKSPAACVLDADALSAFEGNADALFAMIAAKPGSGVVMTPHEGEFARVFPGLASRAANKIEAARIAASQAKSVVVVKGADTVIAHPDGRARVNMNAPPWLATAGSGDVLAGIIGGLLAQGQHPFEAACAGVWLHGDAGDRAGQGLVATDISELLPKSLKNLRGPTKFAL